jgi:predicted hydrocarbon binding protein
VKSQKREKIAKMPWSTDRFVRCLAVQIGEKKASMFMKSCGFIPASSNPDEKAKFAKCLMDNFEKQFPADIRTKVLENCGRGCIGATIIEKARRVKKRARDLDKFVAGLNQQHIGGGKLRHEQAKIYVEYERCYCGMVSKTKEKFSSTYCNCSRGWLLELFEQVFEKPVKVELLQSAIQGAANCKFVIYT